MPAWYVSPGSIVWPKTFCFHWLSGTIPATSPGRSTPVGAPKPNCVRPVGQALDAQHAGQLVEERVARVGEAGLDVDPAPKPRVVPVAELVDPDRIVGLRLDCVAGA